MKEKCVVILSVLTFFCGYAVGYRKEAKNAEKRRQLIREHKIIIN